MCRHSLFQTQCSGYISLRIGEYSRKIPIHTTALFSSPAAGSSILDNRHLSHQAITGVASTRVAYFSCATGSERGPGSDLGSTGPGCAQAGARTHSALSQALSAAQVRGCMSILRPEAMHFSPAVGLLTLSSSALVGNLLRCQGVTGGYGWGLGQSCALARELYFQRSVHDPVRATRSRSQAAAHLTPAMLGHVVGLAVTGAPLAQIQETLRAKGGIQTNRVRGVWTGVSLARYTRVVELVRAAHAEGPGSPAVPLVLRALWERAASKSALLDYLCALDDHLPVLNCASKALKRSAEAREQWLQLAFEAAELEEGPVGAAALALLPPGPAAAPAAPPDPEAFARRLELLAASLSRVHAFKPGVQIERHAYKGGAAVPDCVEVVLRELLALLLFHPPSRSFDLARLPPGAHPAVRAFFSQLTEDGFQSPRDASEAWFLLCQELPGCAYLSRAPAGEEYEVHPCMRNVSHCVGVLLGQPGWTHLSHLQEFWNQHHPPALHLSVHDWHTVEKSMVSDDVTRKENAVLGIGQGAAGLEAASRGPGGAGPGPASPEGTQHAHGSRCRGRGSQHCIEISLDSAHRIATVTHRRVGRLGWVEAARCAHLEAWMNSHGGNLPAALHALWPVLLGRHMVARAAGAMAEAPTLPPQLLLQSLFAAQWGADLALWAPLDQAQNEANRSTAEERRLTTLASTQAVQAVSLVAAGMRGQGGRLGPELLVWLLREAVPHHTDPARLAEALSEAPSEALEVESVQEALRQWDEDRGRIVKHMVRYRACGHSLWDVCVGLRSWHEVAQVLRFAVGWHG